jgi:hypothetical protein
LGGSLTAQRRFDEAESQLLSAYDGLVSVGSRIPAPEKPVIAHTIERLAALYHAWGKDDRAALWDSRLPRGSAFLDEQEGDRLVFVAEHVDARHRSCVPRKAEAGDTAFSGAPLLNTA